ncbi:UDP-N-acetylmuramoyl-L-alanyl-D-glutamate--2,6-diaminopimelate ligase [Patescibacteria group bacterium]|nr:UDP-N-acetylmuramoyl-L-alanyl-D-glutamate--2,6-diaminopimelate ligase [Patescibacteria group bacterium]
MAAILYGHPSNDLIVIGVTGTNGKSSTVQFIAQLLTQLGHRVGYTTTAGFNIAGKEIENRLKMTMPGRFFLQRLLRQMVKAGCTYAIIETTSQGIVQFRHLGINYDMAVFTNLTPEHIEAHGSFKAYKQAKGRLFSHLTKMPRKHLGGEDVPKMSVINDDDKHAQFFAGFASDGCVRFTWLNHEGPDQVSAKYIKRSPEGARIKVNGIEMFVPLRSRFEHQNVLAAMATVQALGIPLASLVEVVEKLEPIPGRFELVKRGQPFEVIVDYAHEPYGIKTLLSAVKELHPKRLIGVHGSTGGGRDVSRRYKIGRLAAQEEDIVIITNEDPYDEDPRQIIEQIAKGARDGGKREGKDLLLIDDRMEAVEQAVALAQEGDVVILTGKGSEPVMAVAGGKKIPWSDRKAAIQALAKRGFV